MAKDTMMERIEGMDSLRALMSVFVVAWHMKIAGGSLAYPQAEYFSRRLTVSDVVNFHVLLLAVPTFMFVSNYLYAALGANVTALRKRAKRIAVLLTFWPVAWIVYTKGFHGLLDIVPHSFSAFVTLILRAGYTIYFFFLSLLVCLLVTHVVAGRTVRVQLWGFIVSITLLSCLPQLSIASGIYQLSAYWSPLNFIPISFAAVLIAQHREYIHAHRAMVLGVLIGLTVLLANFEWTFSAGNIFYPDGGYGIPPYTRSSLVIAVMAIGIVALEAKVHGNVVVQFMAKYALALYCLHLFIKEPISGLVSRVSQPNLVASLSSFVLVILVSYVMAMVLRIYLREEVIM